MEATGGQWRMCWYIFLLKLALGGTFMEARCRRRRRRPLLNTRTCCRRRRRPLSGDLNTHELSLFCSPRSIILRDPPTIMGHQYDSMVLNYFLSATILHCPSVASINSQATSQMLVVHSVV